jgi:hypothetical protein
MPLSDLFKKSPKKKPTQSAETDDLLSPKMQKKRYDAAMEFVQLFQEKTPLVGGKPHAGTVLSIAARLAGTSLFRSIHKEEYTPGTVILSEEANVAYPKLLNLFAFYCKQNGIDVMSKAPVTTFAENDRPKMELAEIQDEYQDQYDAIMQKHGLDYLNGAQAGMIVSSIVFQYHCMKNKDIDPFVATGISAMGVVEGAKTAPPPLGSKGSRSGRTEKKEKNNNRLILGEQSVVIRETADNGGVHIVLNPGVLQTLQQSGIDPYIIHEKGMKKEIDAKIPRIDFVQADVDALFNEWKGKPLEQAPIHVRLIFWLKDNAASHGYEQNGNSWLLK